MIHKLRRMPMITRSHSMPGTHHGLVTPSHTMNGLWFVGCTGCQYGQNAYWQTREGALNDAIGHVRRARGYR